MNQKQSLLLGSLLGFLGVALGAFGAHALKNLLIQNGRLETYELAVRYQFYHTLALIIIGLLMEKWSQKSLRWAALLISIGIILFSGSLYLFALTNHTVFALVTPIGGLVLLFGWSAFVYTISSKGTN